MSGGEKLDRRSVLKGMAAAAAAAFVSNEVLAQSNAEGVPLTGEELGAARYEFFRNGLSEEHPSYKAYMRILEGANKVTFDETACVFLESGDNVRVQGRSFEFTLSPKGVSSGEIPPHVLQFLQFEKKGGSVVNSNFGQKGGAMGLNYVETCDPLVS